MIKKVFVLFLCLSFILSGCNVQNAETSMSLENKKLEIFCLEGANISYALIAFREKFPEVRLSVEKFKTSTEMEDVLINRINTKQAPDIVIFDFSTTLDFEKLAQKKAFYPLTNFVKDDVDFTSEKYLSAAVEVFQSNEEQYFLPFSFMPIIDYSPRSLMESLQISQGETTLEEYFHAVQNHAEENTDDSYTLSFFRLFQVFGAVDIPIVPLLLSVADIDIAEEMNSPNFKEKLKLVIDFSRLIELQDQKAKNAYDTNWSFVNWKNTFAISHSYYDMATDISGYISAYQSYFKEEVEYFMLPTLEDAQKSSCLLSSWGSILADCENPKLAYDFLRCVVDNYEVRFQQNTSMWFTPVSKEKMFENIELYKSRSWMMKDGTVVHPIPDSVAENIIELYHSVTALHFPNPKFENFIATEFYDYFQGISEYDVCYEKFLNKMNLYHEE